MKKTVLKLLLFAAPFLLVSLLTAFQPLNFYCFRPWEALAVFTKRHILLPGPFYPLKKIVMAEEGDLGHGTPFAVKKQVSWETDRFGFRKKDSDAPLDVVVVGDSMIAGAGLTQSEIFTEVLQVKLNRDVYPYAPCSVNDLVHDERFKSRPPKVVIFAQVERDVLQNQPIGAATNFRFGTAPHGPFYMETAIVLDRMVKRELLNFLKSRTESREAALRYNGLLFYEGESAAKDATDSEIRKAASVVAGYRDYFRDRGIRFVYLPIPNKETVYADCLPSKPRFEVLRKLLAELDKVQVPKIDVVSAFESARHSGRHLFLVDDTHWNPTGVDIAAQLAYEHLRQPSILKPAGKGAPLSSSGRTF